MTHSQVHGSVLPTVLLVESLYRKRRSAFHALDSQPTSIGAAIVNHIPREILARLTHKRVKERRQLDGSIVRGRHDSQAALAHASTSS